MAIAHAQSKGMSSPGDPLAVAFDSNVTANSLLIALVYDSGGDGGGSATMSDTLGNSWSNAGTVQASSATGLIYWTQAASGGANTVTADISAGSVARMTIHEFTADGTISVADTDGVFIGGGAGASPDGPPAVTTTTTNGLIIGGVYFGGVDRTATGAGTGFTLGPEGDGRVWGGYRVLTSTATDAPEFTWTGGDLSVGFLAAAFNETIGGGGGLSVPIAMHHHKQLRAAS